MAYSAPPVIPPAKLAAPVAKPTPVATPPANTPAIMTMAGAAKPKAAAKIEVPNTTPLPEYLKLSVELDAKDKATAEKLGVIFKPQDASLKLMGDWKSAPEAPVLTALYSFEAREGVSALDTDLKPAASFPVAGSRSRLYKFQIPFVLPNVTQSVSIVTNGGTVVPIRFIARLEALKPVAIVEPMCGSQGAVTTVDWADPAKVAQSNAAIEQGVTGGDPLVVYVRCTREGAGISVKAWTWKDFRWDAPASGTPGRWLLDPAQPLLVGTLPLYSEAGGGQQAHLYMSRLANRKQRVAVLSFAQADHRAPTWQISVGLGPTWSTYTETATGLPTVKVSQMSLTTKLQASFKIRPPRWDMAASVFGTVLPLSVSPASLASARWVGVNLRVGYLVPFDSAGKNSLAILPGVYAWSMFVAGNHYGVQNLNGPQLVFAFNHETDNKSKGFAVQRFGAYGKFAAVTPGFSMPNLADHELAGGGSIAFKFSFIPRPIVLAADYSTLDFSQKGFALKLDTFSTSLGISF